MEHSGISGGSAKASGSRLQNFLNQVLQCRHRHKTYPFTPRGEDKCYAVCLDCGQRLVAQEPGLQSVHEKPPDGANPGVPTKPGILHNNPAPPDPVGRQNRRYDFLWAGAAFVAGLSGGLYFSGPNHQNRAVPAPAQPSMPSAHTESLAGERKQDGRLPSFANAGHKSSFPLAAVPSEGKSGAAKLGDRIDSSALENIAQSNQKSRLQGKGSIVVLALEEPTVRELSKHRDRLEELIQNGSLFTVPRGTAVKVREVEDGVIKVLILDGSMMGREGWIQAAQVSPRYQASEQSRSGALHDDAADR